ncbi:hypothetical protein GRX03_13895 [Halovenus sp. WSH3]|uniref:Uncharacterized protein n=1 Tax=Halovenus carboxidivorans TaxID=2692199 RepID=A0A6B0TAR1_9EURY|nr:hypothetical protein [Halovenus carboxidivorans]MXR52693.1 hypothetical protein [Halovenus carboxidivorans]
MAARPPSNDLDDEPDTVEFGIVALEARVDDRGVSFPISAGELEAAHGDLRLAVDPSGAKITLAEALAACEQERFESKQDLLNAMHPVFEEKRSSTGLIGRLRALVPF